MAKGLNSTCFLIDDLFIRIIFSNVDKILHIKNVLLLNHDTVVSGKTPLKIYLHWINDKSSVVLL